MTYSDLCLTPLRNVHRLGKYLGLDVRRRPREDATDYIRRLRQDVAIACRGRILVLEDEEIREGCTEDV